MALFAHINYDVLTYESESVGWPLISTVISKLKDILRSQALQSRPCKSGDLISEMSKTEIETLIITVQTTAASDTWPI